jgi:hypothetical protein
MKEGPMRETGPTEPERTTMCAIRYKGEIFIGSSHFEASMKLERAHPQYDIFDTEEGFMTNRGRFIERFEYEDTIGKEEDGDKENVA